MCANLVPLFFSFLLLFSPAAGWASGFNAKYIEVLAKRVGKTYWIADTERKPPLFTASLSRPAASFRPKPKESFDIKEIVTKSTPTPYYRVEFSSGKKGYISVDSFIEELNLTILIYDPDGAEKRRLAKEAEKEKKREAHIRAQPWPEHVKQAAIDRKVVLGMRMKEVEVALGKPPRVVKLDYNPMLGEQEQWLYKEGLVLTFTGGTVSRVQRVEEKVK